MRRIAFIVSFVFACSKPGANKPPRDEAANPWSTVGIGSVFESRTVTHMEKPFAHETETTTRQTLLARSESEASIKLELAEGSGMTTHEMKVPLHADQMPPHDGSVVTTTADEVCLVPAGTFPCTRTTVEVHQGDATNSTVTWTAKQIPVPIKAVVTNENMTITTELTRVAVAP
jgi:hypothetical protein